MIVFPKAKINIGLRITGKRPDGYHNIETLFYPIGLSDALEYVDSSGSVKRDILTVTGINTGSDHEDNLVIKTVKKLREKYSFPLLRIHLHKTIPVGAGLGGGSSDAISLLKSINQCFELNIDKSNMHILALELGSDCPFFIDSTPAFASGRGELLKSIKPVLANYYLVLFNPGTGISTREAYDNCRPVEPPSSLIDLVGHPVKSWKELIINDFEDFAIKRHPMIGDIKRELYRCGALFSLMSGSGSSVYGLFHEKPKIPEKLKNFVIWEGFL